MKKVLCTVACVAVIAGCATFTTNAAKAQQQIANACTVVQPTLLSLQQIEPKITPFVEANGAFCASVSTVDTTTIQNMVNTAIPAAVGLVNTSNLLSDAQKKSFTGAFTAFQVALSAALIVYGPTVTPTATPVTPASAPAA